MTHPNQQSTGQPVDTSGVTPSQATMPALGKTDQELRDSLRPEVVDMDVIERLGEIESVPPSEGSGTSGNVDHPATATPAPAAPRPPA